MSDLDILHYALTLEYLEAARKVSAVDRDEGCEGILGRLQGVVLDVVIAHALVTLEGA